MIHLPDYLMGREARYLLNRYRSGKILKPDPF